MPVRRTSSTAGRAPRPSSRRSTASSAPPNALARVGAWRCSASAGDRIAVRSGARGAAGERRGAGGGGAGDLGVGPRSALRRNGARSRRRASAGSTRERRVESFCSATSHHSLQYRLGGVYGRSKRRQGFGGNLLPPACSGDQGRQPVQYRQHRGRRVTERDRGPRCPVVVLVLVVRSIAGSAGRWGSPFPRPSPLPLYGRRKRVGAAEPGAWEWREACVGCAGAPRSGRRSSSVPAGAGFGFPSP